LNNLISGIKYFIAGFGLITKPGVKRFVIIPLAINILLFLVLFFLLGHFLNSFNHWLSDFLPVWLFWLSWLIWLLFIISFFIIFIFTFVTIGNLIAAPFNSLLAEKVESYLTGRAAEDRGLLENIKDTPRMIARQISVILYYLPRAAGLLLLFFVPVVQGAAGIVWFLFNAWFMTLSFVDYPTDNHRISFTAMRYRLAERRWSSLGFGLAILAAALIPIVQFFVMPAAVAGAVKLWLEEGGDEK